MMHDFAKKNKKKRRIVLNDTAFLFAILCKIVHHSS